MNENGGIETALAATIILRRMTYGNFSFFLSLFLSFSLKHSLILPFESGLIFLELDEDEKARFSAAADYYENLAYTILDSAYTENEVLTVASLAVPLHSPQAWEIDQSGEVFRPKKYGANAAAGVGGGSAGAQGGGAGGDAAKKDSAAATVLKRTRRWKKQVTLIGMSLFLSLMSFSLFV
jgi:hypothetical protein